MWSVIDRITNMTGVIAAWMFFAVGVFVTYEVVMRYVFTAPTIWVDEVSRIMQIWATCLAASYVLRFRKMIIIDALFKDTDTLQRKISESFALVVTLLFAVVTTKFGFDLWLKSTLAGHTTDSFLAPPKWLTHASIWVGFGLLSLQCLVELARVWIIGVPETDGEGGH